MQSVNIVSISSILGRLGWLFAAAGLVGCAVDNGATSLGGAGTDASGGGSAGTVPTVDPGGSTATSGVGGSTAEAGAAASGSAGTLATGGAGDGSAGMTSGGSGGGAGGSDSGTGGMSGGAAGPGGVAAGGVVDAWYEAESPDNEIDNGTVRSTCGKTCSPVADSK